MSERISDIKAQFDAAEESQWERLCIKYSQDSRAGVQAIIHKMRKKQDGLKDERERLKKMRKYEEEHGKLSFICGIDEAGRGPLAGPVVAGAVVLPKDCEILWLNDSKQLSAVKREALYDEIMEKAVAVGVGMASPARIDEINILQATYEAMRVAVGEVEEKLGRKPELLLNDAVRIPDIDIPQLPIVKGDAKSVSIAAASIIAKVTRDRLMIQYDEVIPGYGFAGHKGYGSTAHYEAIRKLGISPIHRKSFLKNIIQEIG